MKKFFGILLLVLAVHIFPSCTHDNLSDAAKQKTVQADDYGDDDDINYPEDGEDDDSQ